MLDFSKWAHCKNDEKITKQTNNKIQNTPKKKQIEKKNYKTRTQ